MDGMEATRRIRTGGASHRSWIVGVTAHAMDGDLAEYSAHGFDEMMPKPVTFDRLDAMLLRRSTTQPDVVSDAEPASSGAASSPKPLENMTFDDETATATPVEDAVINPEIALLIDELQAPQAALAASAKPTVGLRAETVMPDAENLLAPAAEDGLDLSGQVSVPPPLSVVIDEVAPMNSASRAPTTPTDYMPMAATVPASNVLDTQVLNEAMDLLGPVRFMEMANRFRDEARTTMEGLARRLNEAQPDEGPQIAGELHRLAGAAALFGGVTLSRRLAAAEDVLRRDGPAYLIPDLPSLTSAWRALDWALVAAGEPTLTTPPAPTAAPRKSGSGL
jgi:CheY-like chemotaxis protein